MAVGVTGTNPELIIEVKYDSAQSQQDFNKFKSKLERSAELHEQKLKQIQEKGNATRVVSKDKFQDRLEQQQKMHTEKLRRMQEVANQKLLQQQQAYEQRMLRSQTSWSARMSKGLGTLVTSVKLFAAAYAAMFIKQAVSSAFNFVDDLRKQSEAWDINIEKLQVYNQLLNEAGSNTEKNVKIFDKIAIALDEAANGEKKFVEALNNIGVNKLDNIDTAFQKIISGIKDGTVSLSELVDVFGARMAGEIRTIALATSSLAEAKDALGKNIITEEQARNVEKFNDAMDRLLTAVKVGFARAMSEAAGGAEGFLSRLTKSIGEVDWEAVGQGLITIAKGLAFIGKVSEKVAVSLLYIKTLLQTIFVQRELGIGMQMVNSWVQSLFRAQKILETLMSNATSMTQLLKGELSSLSKFYGYLISRLGILKNLGEVVINIFTKISGTLKFLGTQLAIVFPKLTALLKIFSRFSWVAIILFTIYDAWKAIKEGADLVQGAMYGLLKGWIELLDMVTFRLFNLSEWFESFATWKKDPPKIEPEIKFNIPNAIDSYNGFVETMNKMSKDGTKLEKFVFSPEIKGSENKNNKDQNAFTPSVEPVKTYFQTLVDGLNDAITKTKNLKEDTEKYIALLKDYKAKYPDNAAVVSEVNKQLSEQQEILNTIYGDEYVLKFGLPDPEPLGFDFSTDLKKSIDKYLKDNPITKIDTTSILPEWNWSTIIKDTTKEFEDMRVKLSNLEYALGFFSESSAEARKLREEILRLKQELGETTMFEDFEMQMDEIFSDYTNALNFINQTMGEFSNLFNALQDATVQGLNNQLEVLQEIIRLENERWQNASQAMQESGVENTAYYIKLKKEHELYVKQLEAKEYKLKGDAWEADKSAKLTQTIMNTAQAIMSAWAAGPFVGAIMSAIIAATGAIQYTTISNQENPYRRAFGGWIPGTGYQDTIPTMLTPGEYVVNRTAARDNAELLEMINTGRQTNVGNTVVTNVSINGNLVSNSEWVEQDLIPTINKAISKGYELRYN